MSHNFSLLTRINYQNGEEELDTGETSPLRHAAPLFGSAHLLFKKGKLKIDFYSIYNGKFSFNNLATSAIINPPILLSRARQTKLFLFRIINSSGYVITQPT